MALIDDNEGNSIIKNNSDQEPSTSYSQRSIAWQYFKLCSDGYKKGICNYCANVIRLPHGSTTAMFNHLKAKHVEVWKECSERIRKIKSEDLNSSTREVKTSKNTVTLVEKNEIDELVVEMITKDLRPFSSVEDKGFKNLIKRLAPGYDLPCRTTVSRSLVPKLFEKIKENLMKDVATDVGSELKSLSFTTDCWKSRSGDNYISLTLHYMTNDFVHKSVTLRMQQIRESHTGKNLRMHLEAMLNEWNILNLNNLPTFFVTDNARNITNAIAEGGWQHICCFAHTLQLVINDAKRDTAGVESLLVKCRRIATHFHHSDPAKRELEEAQKNASSTQRPLQLIQMVKTRWNSEYEMLERIIKLRIPLSQVLTNSTSVDPLSGIEWSQIKYLINVMKPLYDATIISCGSRYPTLSMVLPLLQGIQYALDNINFNDGTEQQEPAKSFSVNMIKSLRIRFHAVRDLNTYSKTSFLDPRYKGFFFDTEKLNSIKSELRDEIIKSNAVEITDDNNTTISERIHGEVASFWDFMKEPLIPQDEAYNIGQDIEREILLYGHLPRIGPSEDPVLWWSGEKCKLPYLSSMALKYLPIPCTSVESERLFSSAGDIVNEKRSSLSPENVSLLLFLHKNLK